MVNQGIFSVQYHILKSAAENDAKDAAHPWKQSWMLPKTNRHLTELNDQYAALRCKTLGWPWILVHLTELCGCKWTCKWIICAAAKSGFVLQHRVRHKSTLCVPRMTRHSRSSGVWKGIRQTEFCHYFPTRVFSFFQTERNLREQRAWMCYDSRKTRIWWELRETNTGQ